MTGAAPNALSDFPRFDDFALVADPDVYAPVPGDWVIGLSDVVGSTSALADGRYKAVNMAGASMISAAINAVGGTDFPFVFGGDGAAVAVPDAHAERLRDALAATARWVEDDLDLDLRVAMVDVASIRAAGHDVSVARFGVSDAVSYAMFSGGGLRWAEDEMKSGRFAIEPAPPGTRPDLTGLSCRWTPIEAGDGVILSLIARPAESADPGDFADLVQKILRAVGAGREGHPVPPSGPGFTWPPAGLDYEARATRGQTSLSSARRSLYLITLLAWIFDKTGIKVAGIDPGAYRTYTARNTDFRKFDDGLRMTVECSVRIADEIDAMGQDAMSAGLAEFGSHRQSAALMTCIVPSITSNSHFHFLDGAGGGYAMAASKMKAGAAL